MHQGGGTPEVFRRGDRGATASEYLGTIVVVAAIVTAVTGSSLGTQVADAIGTQICRLTGGGDCGTGTEAGDGPKTDADYEPPLCNVSTISDKAGAEAKIAWFTWGNEYGFQQQTFQANTDVNGDGTVDENDQQVLLTFTDAASVGATGDWKPGLSVGKLGTEKVELGGGIEVTNGDTWAFDSPEQAEEFRDDIEEMKTWETSMKYGGSPYGGGNPYAAYQWADKAEEIEEKLGDRHISYGKVALEAAAEAGLKLSASDESKLSAKLGGTFRFSPEVTVTNNNIDGTQSYTYAASMEYGLEGGYEAGPISGSSGGSTTRTGTMTVTRDEETGEIVRIDMTQTVEGEQTDGAGAEGKGDHGKEGDDRKGGGVSAGGSESSEDIRIVTNSISFEPGDAGAADRRIAEAWLEGSGDNTAPFAYMFGDHAPETRPGADDPFGQLLFDEGQSSRMRYTGETDAAEYGFDLTLGMSLGFKVTMENSSQTLQDAEFLGAPKGGRRSYLPYSYCAG